VAFSVASLLFTLGQSCFADKIKDFEKSSREVLKFMKKEKNSTVN
jgi:hypothetical protein